MNEQHDDAVWEALRKLPPYEPRNHRIDPKALLELLDLEERSIRVAFPGDVTLDGDGIPTGVDAPTTTSATFDGSGFTRLEWEALARYLYEERKHR